MLYLWVYERCIRQRRQESEVKKMLAETICRIKKTGLMGIVRVETIERGIEIAQGCIDGGVDVLEISYTNNNAGEVIRALKEKFGDQLLVGAGTVLDPTTARLAIMDGAEFIIAPTFNKEVQEMANLYQIPYAPGCTSYTEMIEALKAGASFIKHSRYPITMDRILPRCSRCHVRRFRFLQAAEQTSTICIPGLKTVWTVLVWADF